jgi:hypothetical protein
MLDGVWQAGRMKKQLPDQQFHDRRHQERKRAEEARRPAKKKAAGGDSVAEAGKSGGEEREAS